MHLSLEQTKPLHNPLQPTPRPRSVLFQHLCDAHSDRSEAVNVCQPSPHWPLDKSSLLQAGHQKEKGLHSRHAWAGVWAAAFPSVLSWTLGASPFLPAQTCADVIKLNLWVSAVPGLLGRLCRVASGCWKHSYLPGKGGKHTWLLKMQHVRIPLLSHQAPGTMFVDNPIGIPGEQIPRVRAHILLHAAWL